MESNVPGSEGQGDPLKIGTGGFDKEGQFTKGEKVDFSLVLGGPLFQLLTRAKLLKPPLELVKRRMLFFAIIAWLPPALLTIMAGTFLSGVKVPFLYDLDTHVRFLISLPLLIAAELIIHRCIRPAVEQFVERGLILPDDMERFKSIIANTWRLRNSVTAEVILLALAFAGGYWLWRTQLSLHVASWYAAGEDGSLRLTWAGWWYAFISLPIGRFILMRWYYRIFIWYSFLWKVSRLRLGINPLHPDRVGGFEFLGYALYAFAPVLIAQSAMLAGLIGNRIGHEGARLPEFKFEIAGFMVFLLLLVLVPLFFFCPQMVQAKRAAIRNYGTLGTCYVNRFQKKWMKGDKAPDEDLLGSGDFQSLADLGNSYEVVQEMRPLPITKPVVLGLFILTAIPLLPLVLTMAPLEVILKQLFSLVF